MNCPDKVMYQANACDITMDVIEKRQRLLPSSYASV